MHSLGYNNEIMKFFSYPDSLDNVVYNISIWVVSVHSTESQKISLQNPQSGWRISSGYPADIRDISFLLKNIWYVQFIVFIL